MSDRQCESPLLPDSKRQLQLVLPRIILLTTGFGSLAYNLTWYLMSGQMTVCYTSDKDSNSDKGSRTLMQWSPPAMWLMWCYYLYGGRVVEIVKEGAIFCQFSVWRGEFKPHLDHLRFLNRNLQRVHQSMVEVHQWWMAQMEADEMGAWILWESLFRSICFALNTKPYILCVSSQNFYLLKAHSQCHISPIQNRAWSKFIINNTFSI